MRRLLTLFLFVPHMALAQVTLQPWVEGFGSYNGQQLGKYVTGITPSANFPYRAAISQVGSTGIYRLNSPSDTSVQQVFFGENLLTGDLNNDGFLDAVVSRTVNNYDTVLIYWGTSTGIDTLNPLRIPGETQYDGLKPGYIGDVNNDGFVDLICTAPAYPNQLGYGKVYFHLGPVILSIASDTLIGSGILDRLGGGSVLGDLNDDGFNDLILRGSHNPPTGSSYSYVSIYWGAGPDTLNLSLGLQMRTSVTVGPGMASFDANWDGRDDLLWTALDSVGVRIFIHYGRTSFDTIPDIKLRNPGVGTFGYAVANAGDMNGDGYNDVMVGCPQQGNVFGVALVYGAGPLIDPLVDAAVSRGSDAAFGRTLASLDDVTGDGLADIIVGGPTDPFGENRGRWGIFKGDSTIRVTSIEQREFLPQQFTLGDAYPNPFNPSTSIPYEMHTVGMITLQIIDELGRRVKTLVQGVRQPGKYITRFDGSGHASGVYYYQMIAEQRQGTRFTQTKKLVLVK